MTTKISPLNIKIRLAPTPDQEPKYFEIVKDKNGQNVKVGDPNVTRALTAIMNMHAINGGAASHWGGPAAFAEIIASIHAIMFKKDINQNWFNRFHFVNDAGHTENGVYALKANLGYDNLSFENLKLFRSSESKLTGHGEEHVNPEGVFISNGPLGSGVPQAQGLAIADKIIENDRVTICTISDGACMEGEAKEAFAAIPGFAQKDKLNPFVLVISFNNKKLSGKIDKDAFSMDPTMKSMESLGWKVLDVKNGHNLQQVFTTIEEGIEFAKKNHNKPVCIICNTIKGYGVKSTSESDSGGHGFPLKKYDAKLIDFINEIFNGNVPQEFSKMAQDAIIPPNKPITNSNENNANKIPEEKIQAGLSRGIINAAKEGVPVFSISSDLQGSTGMKNFHKEFPNCFIEVGVAESNMISTAIGLSKCGFIPIVDTFAQFGTTKGNLPLIMSALSNGPIIGVFSHTGFQDAADGASHQATTYFSSVSSIPYTDVISCSCSLEAEKLIYETIKNMYQKRSKNLKTNSTIFFIGRENFPIYLNSNKNYQLGKAQVFEENTNSELLIVSTGSLVKEALEAQKALKQCGINVTCINNHMINKPDIETIGKCLEKSSGRLITIEDHQIIGGMGHLLVHSLNRNGFKIDKLVSMGIDGHFGRSAYTSEDLYKKYGLSADHIINSAKNLLN